jgi:hypothetical protein
LGFESKFASAVQISLAPGGRMNIRKNLSRRSTRPHHHHHHHMSEQAIEHETNDSLRQGSVRQGYSGRPCRRQSCHVISSTRSKIATGTQRRIARSFARHGAPFFRRAVARVLFAYARLYALDSNPSFMAAHRIHAREYKFGFKSCALAIGLLGPFGLLPARSD